MSSAGKPIHPEVMYAERSSDTDPEKVSNPSLSVNVAVWDE